MSNEFYIVKDCFELIAYISTTLGVVSIIFAIIVLIKNRLTSKNVQIELTTYSFEISNANLEIQNFTDKAFSIISCQLKTNRKEYKVYAPTNPTQFNSTLTEVNNIFVGPHCIETIYRIFSDMPITELKRAKIEINTTQGKLIYRLNHRKRVHFFD